MDRVLTGLNVDLESCVLVAGEHAEYDGIVAVLDELLNLLCGLDLLGRRPRLLSHEVDDT